MAGGDKRLLATGVTRRDRPTRQKPLRLVAIAETSSAKVAWTSNPFLATIQTGAVIYVATLDPGRSGFKQGRSGKGRIALGQSGALTGQRRNSVMMAVILSYLYSTVC
jgi:hypothetical protein